MGIKIKNYRDLQQIGEGGYGLVYKAEQINTGQSVAIKMLKIQDSLPAKKKHKQLARFEREVLLCAQINHPNIVQLIDKGYTDNNEPYAVYEYIEGETLKAYILRKKYLTASNMAALMEQVLEALIFAHSKGIVHRDLKPNNIMVTSLGSKRHVKILDFGIGAFTHEFRSTDYKSLTITQDLIGTPTYIAPEQLKGEPPTIKSDLYAWGLIVIECLTGKPLMDGSTVADVYQKQLTPSNVPIPPSIAGHPLGNLLRKVLEKHAENRAESALVVLDEFEQINFNTLVGNIEVRNNELKSIGDETVANTLVWSDTKGCKKQLTVLCFRLDIDYIKDEEADLEKLDAIQKTHMNQCIGIANKYKGYVTESFMNTVAVYYGYPESSDTDARMAGRTALELSTEVNKASMQLLEKQGVQVNLQISIHSGTVLIKPSYPPKGKVLNATLDLVVAKSGCILVSSSSKKLLDPYFEFEEEGEFNIPNGRETILTYRLIRERHSGTTSLLHPRSTNRDLIGREKEMTAIRKVWDKLNYGGHAILINGVPGIGKSRLIHEVKKHICSSEDKILQCRCLPEHQNNALYPFFNMFRNQWRIVEFEDSNVIADQLKQVLVESGCILEDCLPVLYSWLSVPVPDGYTIKLGTPEEQKHLLFETLKLCLLSLGKGRNSLLVIEDLHWLDHTSQEFVEYILSDIEQQRFLVLMSARPVFKNLWNKDLVSQIDLKILSDNHIDLLVRNTLDGNLVSKKALKYISEKADGIPLYAEELTSMLVDQQYIIFDNGGYELVDDIALKMIPVTLQDLLNARLDGLGLTKETANLASAIGREFSKDLLVKSSLKDASDVEFDLEELIKADLVCEQRNGRCDNYVFRHALIKDAAYDGMVHSNQKQVHNRIATVLEKYYPERVKENPFEAALHLAKAEKYGSAIPYGIQAVENEIRKSANKSAIDLKEKILNWIPKMVDEKNRDIRELELNSSIATALMAVGGYGSTKVQELNQRNDELISLIRSHQPEAINKELQLLIQQSEWSNYLYYHLSSQRKKAHRLGKEIMQSLKENPDRERELGLSVLIGQGFHADGDIQEAERIYRRAIDLYDDEKDLEIGMKYGGTDPKGMAYSLLAHTRISMGYPNSSLRLIDKAIEHSEKNTHIMTIAASYVFKAIIGYYLKDKNYVLCAYNAYSAKYPEQKEHLWTYTHLRMFVDWARGNTEYAENYVKNSLESGQHAYLSWYEPSLAETYLSIGEYDKAIALITASLERCYEDDEKWTLPILKRMLALSLYEKEKKATETVIQLLNESVASAQTLHLKWFELESLVSLCEILSMGDERKQRLIELKNLINELEEGKEAILYKIALNLSNNMI